MQNIIVAATDVWNYFHKNYDRLQTEEQLIADNKEYGVEISLSAIQGLPCLSVYADGYQYDEDAALTEEECKEVTQNFYERYLTGSFIEEETLLEQEDMITEREYELDEAMLTLLDTLLGDNVMTIEGPSIDAICEDLKEHILEYMFKKHHISVRRPMILEDVDTGEDFFVEYPYNCMEFDD